MRIYSGTTVDYEFAELRTLGYTGTLNDMQFSALRAEGYAGALPDMFGQFSGSLSGGGTPAVLSNLAYADDQISVDTTIASGTIYGLLHTSSTPMDGEDIKADVLDLSAVGGFTLDASDTLNQPVDWTAETPDTYWLQMVQDTGVLSNVVVLEVTLVTAYDPAADADFVWDASDLTSLWQANNGTSQVTASGQTVGSMTNRGTKGGLFTNTGGSDEPTYTESGVLRYLEFDGTADYLRWLGSNGDINLSAGIYMVVGMQEMTATTSEGWVTGSNIGGASFNSTQGFMLFGENTSTAAAYFSGGTFNADGVQVADYSGTGQLPLAVVEVEVVPATGSVNGWMRVRRVADGDVVEVYTDTSSSGTFPNTANNLAQIVLGANIISGSPADFANIRLYCGIIKLGAVSSGVRADMRLWVAGKIGF